MRVERTLVGLLLAAMVAAPGCGRLAYNLPPANRIMEPGPGVGGPGPGVIPPAGSLYGVYGGAIGRFGDGQGSYIGGGGDCTPGPGACGPYGAIPAPSPNGVVQASYNGPDGCDQGCPGGGDGSCPCDGSCPYGSADGCADGGCMNGGCMNGAGVQPAGLHHMFGHGGHGFDGCIGPGRTEAYADGGAGVGMATSQIAFLGSDGVQVQWDVSGSGAFDSTALVIPGRQDFYQGAIYRLKLSNIPGRPGVTLYPTLEVAPVTPRTDAYLAHSPIPVQFTEEDFDQALSGNFVTKVIYLPDPEFQELALAGVETLVSTRLDPGVDPIAEADRRGSILAIVRLGNKNLEMGGASIQAPPETVVPASHEEAADGAHNASQAMYNEPVGAPDEPARFNVSPAQYCEGGCPTDGGCYGNGAGANMPVGMPTSGFAPGPVPPNMVAGAPQWGMPITGTPIGLPGPPHVPLGVPAGLQKHVMTNRTRVMIPPPVSKVHLSVKQRPGLNYPRPVDHAYVDETQREPFRLLPAWVTEKFQAHHVGNAGAYSGGPCPQ
jgi:hypothetical protein